jgi:phosphatidylserine/phosphatidylglycerophosphate/cardiolipin synthase-like enzyme
LFVTVSFFSSLHSEENRIIPCENGLETLEWNLKFINHATKSIEFAGCYTGGEIFQKFLSAFEKRLQAVPTLEVFILANPALLEKNDFASVSKLKKQYGSRVYFQLATPSVSPFPDFATTDSHVKCLVVDETYFSAGGTNFHSSLCSEGTTTPKKDANGLTVNNLLSAGARDQDIVGKGPIAKDLRLAFHKLFAIWDSYLTQGNYFEKDPEAFVNRSFYRPILAKDKPTISEFDNKAHKLGDFGMEFILGTPTDDVNSITKRYCDLVNNAKEEIVIANLYFNPARPLLKCMLNAANRGVKFNVITNGCGDRAPHYNKFFGWASRINYVPLLYGREWRFGDVNLAAKAPINKVQIYEYDVFDVLYHKKVMVVDRRFVVMGSYNLSFRSDKGDYEIAFLIDSKEIAERVLNVIEKDKNYSAPISPEQARKWYFDFDTALKGAFQKQFNGILG